MVISGTNVTKSKLQQSRVATARIEDGRIRLPQHVTDQLRWLQGADVLHVWLLVAEIGRYCIFCEHDFERNARLRELRDKMNQQKEADDELENRLESAEAASLSARLLPTVLSPKGPGWRLSIPADLPPIGTAEEGTIMYLTVSRERLEIWSRHRLDQLLQTPITNIYPGL
jgi:hypothetical protein